MGDNFRSVVVFRGKGFLRRHFSRAQISIGSNFLGMTWRGYFSRGVFFRSGKVFKMFPMSDSLFLGMNNGVTKFTLAFLR